MSSTCSIGGRNDQKSLVKNLKFWDNIRMNLKDISDRLWALVKGALC
jgi:hypothetical protein